MIPHEPSYRLRVLYREHVPVELDGPPSLSLESHVDTVRQARDWGVRRRLLADVLGVADEFIWAIEEELGLQLDP
ncbi:MAG: hypothetical protein ACRDZ7_20900 [Acidimicrobiia bacterium]